MFPSLPPSFPCSLKINKYLFYFKHLFKRFYLFLESGEGREKERERNISV